MADSFVPVTFVADELLTSTKMNLLAANQAGFHDGTALGDGIIVTRHLGSNAAKADNIDFSTFEHTFIYPTMLNGWVVFSSNYEPARYMKDNLGFVHLDGVIKGGTVGSTIFMLPVGFRPNKHQYIAVGASGNFGILEVMLTGEVKHAVGSTASFSLSSIAFPSF